MIVVATNNGIDFLPNLLESMEKYGTDGHMVAVVDTGSTDTTAIEYVRGCGERFDFAFPYFINGGRDTGAYITIFKKFKSLNENFMFMHDSMLIKDHEWLSRFEHKIDHITGLVAHSLFPIVSDQWPPCQSIKDKLPFNPDEETWEYGIFGPIFLAKHRFMLDVIDNGCDKMIPVDRDEAHGTERLWGAIAKKLSWGVKSVYGLYDHDKLQQDAYDGLQKFLPIRP
jgi:hypothetical protein